MKAVSGEPYDLVHPALDLLNSDHGRGLGLTDLLEETGWLDGFCDHWGYAPAGRPSAGDLEELRDLRTVLRRVVEALDAGAPPSRADVSRLNGILAGAELVRELVAGAARIELRLAPTVHDWRWVRAEITASLAELLAGGDPSRLKVCDNQDCRFAFYDLSKNRSRRWCAQTVCGNRHKVRQFRARRRAAGR